MTVSLTERSTDVMRLDSKGKGERYALLEFTGSVLLCTDRNGAMALYMALLNRPGSKLM